MRGVDGREGIVEREEMEEMVVPDEARDMEREAVAVMGMLMDGQEGIVGSEDTNAAD